MNNSTKLWRNVAVGITVAALVVAGFFALKVWDHHQQSSDSASLAAGYATQPLTAPFTFVSKTWDAASGTWQYHYTTNLDVPDTVAAAKSQFSKGAYQVDARQPDVISANSATLYRDLITEDVALKIEIQPAAAVTGPPTLVTVTLSSLAGG